MFFKIMKRQTGQYFFELEGDTIPIRIRKLSSARRMVIRYQSLGHTLSLTLPRYVTIRQGLHFIEEKRDWIIRQINAHPLHIPFTHGQVIPVFGREYTLCHKGGRGVISMDGTRIHVPGEESFMARRVREWLKARVKEEITRIATEKAAIIAKPIKKIGVRDTSSHWGSCNQQGNLSFSWRLIFAPHAVLEYVVCHEVAHLAELNHSARFWAVTERLCPEYEQLKDWLKYHGKTLYAYG
jgi:predicted metal-dependent hydrolase